MLPGLLADALIAVALYFGFQWLQQRIEERSDVVPTWATFESRKRGLERDWIVVCTMGPPRMTVFVEFVEDSAPKPDSLKKKPVMLRVSDSGRR